MTKKHFEALADALAGVRPDEGRYQTQRQMWEKCVLAVGFVCGDSNINFNLSRFTDACEDRPNGG